MGDYAQYILHARALAEGRSYTDTEYMYSTYEPYLGPRAYPPGLPLLLAGFFGVTVGNWFRTYVVSAATAVALGFPYVDELASEPQLDALRAWRQAREAEAPEAEQLLEQLLLLTNAISGGLKNTG